MRAWLLLPCFMMPLIPSCDGGGPSNPFSMKPKTTHSRPAGPSLSGCFCPLASGLLDDCPCSANTVDSFNNNSVHPLLTSLLQTPYFRYFQVDFSRPCTHWPAGEGKCSSPLCGVDTCEEEQVLGPGLRKAEEGKAESGESDSDTYFGSIMSSLLSSLPWLEPYLNTLQELLFRPRGCEDPYPQHHEVDPTLPQHMKQDQQFCPLDTENDGASCQYVDLVTNEEKFTGYSGRAANKVWEKIYGELCFQPENRVEQLNSQTIKNMCLEKRAFYRVVSGLHSSISVHLCSRYLLEEENPLMGQPEVWGKNYPEFARRFSPVTTGSEGPERLKNVYFTYLLELRALVKAAPFLQDLNTDTGNAREDEETRGMLLDLLRLAKDFPHQFDEGQLFRDEAKELLTGYKEKVTEIKRVMDCLGCERCKVWGKLQVTGLGTALKILFSPPELALDLTRHEVVALLNAFGRLSTSIVEIGQFREAA